MKTTTSSLLVLVALPLTSTGQGTNVEAVVAEGNSDLRADFPIHTLVLTAPYDGADQPAGSSTGPLFRFGSTQRLDLDFMNAAEWTSQNNLVVGRLALKSPGARTMNLLFSSFVLTGHAEVFVHDTEKRSALSYSAATRKGDDGKLQTAMVPGDEIVIEFRGSLLERNASVVHIEHVIHGVMDFFHLDDAERGGGCLIDVACSLGDNWLDQRRSVVLFTKENNTACTGVILNNTAEDFTPYVHIANHCRSGSPSNWVFYFNYENSGCSSGSAPQNITLTGSTLVSNEHNGDFALLELDDPIPASYNAFYAGWDRTSSTPSDGVYIGHPVETDLPSLDAEKKIGAYSGATSGTIGSFSKPGWIVDIDQGGLLGGSSGSPLFNSAKRMIGHVWSGDTDCNDALIQRLQ